jgi:hypothetical protein
VTARSSINQWAKGGPAVFSEQQSTPWGNTIGVSFRMDMPRTLVEAVTFLAITDYTSSLRPLHLLPDESTLLRREPSRIGRNVEQNPDAPRRHSPC